MSGHDVERERAEHFRDGPPGASAELRRGVTAARMERPVPLRSRSGRFRTACSLLSLAVTIVLAASALFLLSGRGGLGTGGPSPDTSGSPSASPTSSAGESASAEASTSEGPTPSASASLEARPTPTLKAPTSDTPSGHFSSAGPTPEFMGLPTSLTIATLLVDGRVLFTGGNTAVGATLYDPATGKFSATGPATNHHSRGTATRLADGRVLLAGGADTTGNETATAEIYDPSTGKFSPTGSMAVVRVDPAAALLPNGEVLIVGGTTPSGANMVDVRSAELYDPSTGRFKPAGQMTATRAVPTAVALADGRVLIAGGGYGVNSAEIYDPKTGLFNATGQMATIRETAAAVLLLDGRVLITGTDGWAAGKPSAELYDPNTGAFSPTTGPMVVDRFSHTATLLYDGRVLIAGGYSNPFARGSVNRKVLAMTAERNQATAEVYDPGTGKFTATGSMSVPRAAHTATRLLDGRVLIADGNLSAGPRAELYQP